MGLEFTSSYHAKPKIVVEAVQAFLDANTTTFCDVSLDLKSGRFDFNFRELRPRDNGEPKDAFLVIEEGQIYLRFFAGLYQDAERTVELLAQALRRFGIVTSFEEP